MIHVPRCRRRYFAMPPFLTCNRCSDFSFRRKMNTSNLGLSATATRQMERMIDDAAWLTYPLHLAVGVIKDLVYVLFLLSAVIVYTIVWMTTAHDSRADE